MTIPAPGPRAPAWCLLLVGWCLGAARPAPAPPPPRSTRALPAPRAPAPSPASLRAIDGVGARRAVQLARHLWSRAGTAGAGLDELESLPGVGPVTAGAVRAELAGGPAPGRLPR